MIQFRDLPAAEIECRVGTANEKGCSILLYKDARCDMNILDETVGPENWQREHYDCKGNLFCRVGVNVTFDIPESSPLWVWQSATALSEPASTGALGVSYTLRLSSGFLWQTKTASQTTR